jgi:hypothetical protein
VLEHDDQDLCFGLVVGLETEVGYFSLAEMRDIRGPGGLRIERDLWFEPQPVRELADYQDKWGQGGPYPGKPAKAIHENPPPWQITRLSYQQSKAAQVADGVPILNAADGEEHHRQVQAAVERGDPVPDNILADYPDLVPFEKQATGEQAQELLQSAAALVPDMIGDDASLEIPDGSLTVLYPNSLTTELLWTGDTRTFSQAGRECLLRAFAYLHGIATYVREQLGCQVLSVSKAFDASTQVLVAEKQVPDSYYETTLNLWGEVAFSLATTTPQDALTLTVQGCYAGPDLPDEWAIEGLHLDAEIRALLHQAYQHEQVEGPVFQIEFSEQVQTLAAEHHIFQYLKPFKLWSLERFWQSASLDVHQRRSWKYVLPEKRRLAAALVGNVPTMLAELENELPEKRRNTLLSELADLDQLPVGWITAQQAGQPLPEEVVPISPPTVEDQAEFQQWSLELLTGRIQPRSAFHKALEQITLPGALRLALDKIDGDTERRGHIELRLRQLTQAI